MKFLNTFLIIALVLFSSGFYFGHYGYEGYNFNNYNYLHTEYPEPTYVKFAYHYTDFPEYPSNWRNKPLYNPIFYENELWEGQTYTQPYYYSPRWDPIQQHYNWRF